MAQARALRASGEVSAALALLSAIPLTQAGPEQRLLWGELLLETGSVELFAGDMVMIPGTAHGWRAGPEGVVLQVVLIGLDPDPEPADVIVQDH